MKTAIGLILVIGLVCLGCSKVKDSKSDVVAGPLNDDALWEKTDEFELYSLNPETQLKADEGFHGWQVLAVTLVKEKKDRMELLEAMRSGVKENEGMVADCFNPHHGIRLRNGAVTTDLVICFQCLQVQVFKDGKRQGGFLTSKGPEKTFHRVLKAAGS
jgi:hypothetical protein